MPKENIINLEENKNNEENKNLEMLGKKRKPSSHLEEIEEKKDKIDIKINININNNQNNVLNNTNKNNNKNNICKLKSISENEDFFSQVIQNEQNLFIDCEELLKMLCHCEECSKKYNEIGMNFLNEKNVFKEWTERKTFDDIYGLYCTSWNNYVEKAGIGSVSVSDENDIQTIELSISGLEYTVTLNPMAEVPTIVYEVIEVA